MCRKEGIARGLYYSWSKEFLEAGKKRLAGDTAREASSHEVHTMRAQTQALKEAVADLTVENRLLKKSMIGDGGERGSGTRLRRSRRSSDLLRARTWVSNARWIGWGVARLTVYRWYAQFLKRGAAGLSNKYRGPTRVWNRVPEGIRAKLMEVALELPELSPRELAVCFTHTYSYYVSESTMYRFLKAHGLIISPEFVVIRASNEFKDKTTGVNQLWQTDFTYLQSHRLGLAVPLNDFGCVKSTCEYM